jgi:hypothetical protein
MRYKSVWWMVIRSCFVKYQFIEAWMHSVSSNFATWCWLVIARSSCHNGLQWYQINIQRHCAWLQSSMLV